MTKLTVYILIVQEIGSIMNKPESNSETGFGNQKGFLEDLENTGLDVGRAFSGIDSFEDGDMQPTSKDDQLSEDL